MTTKVIQTLNAVSMIPGIVAAMHYIHKLDDTRAAYAPATYVFVCLASMNYHLTKGWFGYSAAAHRLDLLAQQIGAWTSALANLNTRGYTYLVFCILFVIMLSCDLDHKRQKQIAHATNSLAIVLASYTIGDPYIWLGLYATTIALFVFAHFHVGCLSLNFLHVPFHLSLHFGCIYFWDQLRSSSSQALSFHET